MADGKAPLDPLATVQRINDAWLSGHVEWLNELLHPDIVMMFPGFSGTSPGAAAMIAGFEDFVTHAEVEEFMAARWHVHEAGESAVVTFTYEVIYRRDGGRYLSTGRDLWVLTRVDGVWKASWRTMFDVAERPAPED